MKSDPSPTRRTGRAIKPATLASGTVFGVAALLLPAGAVWNSLFAATRPSEITFALQPISVVAIVAAIIVVILLNAVFVAGEVAVDLLRPNHLKETDEDSAESQTLIKLMERKESVVAACVIGALTMRSWLVLLCFPPAYWIASATGYLLPENPPATNFLNVFLIGVAVSIPVMFLNVIVVDLVAKTYAVNRTELAAVRLARPLYLFDILFRPVASLVIATGGLFTKRFGSPRFSTDASRAEVEIKDILDSSEETGEIEDTERELLQSVFEFGDTVAREVMTPRIDIEAIPLATDLKTVANLVEATGFSRFPVYEETDDQIVGIVHAKDVLRALSRGQKDTDLTNIKRRAAFVTENKPLHDLLAEMRHAKAQMAIVQDEFGGTAGLVTIEDIVEELVGEIIDEYDVETPEIVPNGTGHSVNGKIHLDDLNDAIGTDFESEEFDTIGGYLFGLFGRQPSIGESLDHEGYRLVVEDSDGRRIHRVKVEPAPEEALSPDEIR